MPRGDGTGPIWGGGPGAGRGRGMGRGGQRGISSGLTPQTNQVQQLKAFVDEKKCVGCGVCVNVCKMGAITVDDVAKVNLDRCIGCGICVGACPQGAITLKEYLKNK